MPIQVICPGCRTRFKVSDQYAGRRGPCPKCKNEIVIPSKDDEIVIHAPQTTETKKGAMSPSVFQPIKRTETKVTPLRVAVVLISIAAVFAIAFVLRSPEGDVHWGILTLGALLLGPPLAIAGYSFLRDDELEPYTGASLFLRAAICGAVYALLWLLYAFVPGYVGLEPLEVYHLAIIVPLFVAGGAATALVAFELDFLTGILHYGLYLVVTVVLCLVMGVHLLG